jgi:hypothetical protein
MIKPTAEDWRWLAKLLQIQERPEEHERLLRLATGCRERAEELEADTTREPLSFIEMSDNRWLLGYSSKPFAAPEGAKHGFWILAFALEHPGEDIDVRPFGAPGDGSSPETFAAHISRARQIIATHRPELETYLRAVKFNRKSTAACYTPPPGVAPLRFS